MRQKTTSAETVHMPVFVVRFAMPSLLVAVRAEPLRPSPAPEGVNPGRGARYWHGSPSAPSVMGSDAEERTSATSVATSPVGHSCWLVVPGPSPASPWSLTALAATEAEHRYDHGIRYVDCVINSHRPHVGAASDGCQAATAVDEACATCSQGDADLEEVGGGTPALWPPPLCTSSSSSSKLPYACCSS